MANLSHKLLAEEKSSAGMLFDSSSRRPGLGREAGEGASNFLDADVKSSLLDSATRTAALLKGGDGHDADAAGSQAADSLTGEALVRARSARRRGAEEAAEETAAKQSDAVSRAKEAVKQKAAETADKADTATREAFGIDKDYHPVKSAKKTVSEIPDRLDTKARSSFGIDKDYHPVKDAKDYVKSTPDRMDTRARRALGIDKDYHPVKSAKMKAKSAPGRFRRRAMERMRSAFGLNPTAAKPTGIAKVLKAAGNVIKGVAAAVPVAGIAVVAVASTVVVTSLLGGILTTMAGDFGSTGGNDGEKLAAYAIGEYERYEAANSLDKLRKIKTYVSHSGYDEGSAWCSLFVKYCWDMCGFDKTLGSPPGVGMANSWLTWAAHDSSKGKILAYDSSYTARPGDIIVAGEADGYSTHVGIVVTAGDWKSFEIVDGNPRVARYVVTGSFVEWKYVFRPNYPNSGGTGLAEGVNFNVSEKKFVREWGPRIDAYFARKNGSAPLNGHGEVFARSAYRGKMDPRWLPAVSWWESNAGLAVPSYAPYNCYGWGITDSGVTSVAYSNGYDQFIAFILENAGTRDNGWAGSKVLNEYTSLAELDDEYCSSSADRISALANDMLSI